jgi:antitoxin (DNA-binding transcriptional repressor) of toxin-antitoxin stability system
MTTHSDGGVKMNQEHVTKSQFKARALEYFRKIEASGKPIVITDRGRPTIEIRRYRSDQRSPLERLRGSVVEFRVPTAPVGEEEWEALA